MRNQIHRVFAIFAVFLGLAVAGVQAQAPSKVEVDIPFEFSAGKVTLKPGVYAIKRLSGSNMLLRRSDGKSAVILNAPLTLTSSDSQSVERLVFNKYGEQYSLSQIWLTADTGRQLFVERKAAKPQHIEISLRLKDKPRDVRWEYNPSYTPLHDNHGQP